MQLPFNDPLAAACLPLRVITHNIRYAATDLKKNEKPWEERRHLISSQLEYHTRYLNSPCSLQHNEGSTRRPGAAIIGLQEVLHEQLMDIMSDLNNVSTKNVHGSDAPDWAYIGVGREDGVTEGEYSPIIYSPQVFDLRHYETIWLSPTPEKPSIGWDAGSIRILTIGVLEHRGTGQRILACNTHLDNSGAESRKRSVGIILEKINEMRRDWEMGTAGHDQLPVVLTGDFNSFPTQEAYLEMAASDLMYDLRNKTEASSRYGDGNTFTGFDEQVEDHERGRIDFIWLGPKSDRHHQDSEPTDPTTDAAGGLPAARRMEWTVEGYAVLPNFFNGIYCSDHKAVVGDICLHRS